MRPLKGSFIGIGAQKAATTWLYGVLQQCSKVRMSDEKELDFFSYYFDRGYEWYERHFEGAEADLHRGDISPSYLIHPDAPSRAAQYNPDMQVFVVLRDPVDRAFSNHLHEARKGHVSGANLTFEAALDNNPLYRDQGRYAHHLAAWLDVFPASQITVLFQEDIHADRRAAANQVTAALGLPDIEDFLDLRANESVRYRNAAVGEALWKAGNFARKKGMGRVAEVAKSLPVVRQMRQANRTQMRSLVAPMQDDTTQDLTEFYRQDVEALEALLGRSVPWQRFR